MMDFDADGRYLIWKRAFKVVFCSRRRQFLKTSSTNDKQSGKLVFFGLFNQLWLCDGKGVVHYGISLVKLVCF